MDNVLACVVIAILFVHHGKSLSQIRGTLTEADLLSYSKTAVIKDYDIIFPSFQDLNTISKRSINSGGQNDTEAKEVVFSAFEEDHHVILESNSDFLRSDLQVEYVGEDGSIRKEPVKTRHCHFLAKSISHEGSEGALSTCGGFMRGLLTINDDVLYIEPLKEHHARRIRRTGDDDTSHPHLIYKKDPSVTEMFDSPSGHFAGNTGDEAAGSAAGGETLYDGPYLGAKYIEIFFVLDSVVYDEFGEDTEAYATTLINIMSRRYQDPSLDISIRLSVARLMIATSSTISAITPGGSTVRLSVTDDAEISLNDFCVWQAQLSYDDDTNPDDWDLAILLTGRDIRRSDVGYDILGLASVGGTCDLNWKCSIIEDSGLSAGLVMSHETGHSLNLMHDGDYGCDDHVNIMSASATSGPGAFRWSSCSSNHMKIFISTLTCMDDVPSTSLGSINVLPGQTYTADQQCQIAWNEPTAYSCVSLTSCSLLYCTTPSSSTCFSAGTLAEGTPCGDGMQWCISSECVGSSLPMSPSVDGGWTGFGDYGSCSRTCGTGVQSRDRSCTNPTPQWGGAPCDGDSHEYKMCIQDACPVSEDTFRDEQCAATNQSPLGGALYEWIDNPDSLSPPLTGDSLCSLICIAPSASVFNDRPGDFCDGTRCWDDPVADIRTRKICVFGKCLNFGCDGVLDSGLVYDDCGVCNGDGSSCICTTQTITTAPTVESVITVIPRGSTSVSVTSRLDAIVGLRVNGYFIFGVDTSGSPVVTYGGRYTAGSMDLFFDYSSFSDNSFTSLTEPTTEDLDVLLYALSTTVSVTYRYCTPSVSVTTTPSTPTVATTSPPQTTKASVVTTPSISTTQSTVKSTQPSTTITARSTKEATTASHPTSRPTTIITTTRTTTVTTSQSTKEATTVSQPTSRPTTKITTVTTPSSTTSTAQSTKKATTGIISYGLSVSILAIDGVDNSSFPDIVDDQDSDESEDVKQQITDLITNIYKGHYGPLFIALKILGFRLGSLVVDAELQFVNDASGVPTLEEAVQSFNNSFAANGTTIDGLTFDPATITVTDVDECASVTSNDCATTARCINTVGSFTCSCAEGFVDTSPADVGAGRICEESPVEGLSMTVLIGVIVGGSVVFLLFVSLVIICSVCCKRKSTSTSESKPKTNDFHEDRHVAFHLPPFPSGIELGKVG